MIIKMIPMTNPEKLNEQITRLDERIAAIDQKIEELEEARAYIQGAINGR